MTEETAILILEALIDIFWAIACIGIAIVFNLGLMISVFDRNKHLDRKN